MIRSFLSLFSIRRLSRFYRTLLLLLVSGLISFFVMSLRLDYFEAYLFDLRTTLRPSPEPNKNIVLVMVDKESVIKNKSIPNLSLHAKLLEKIHNQSPSAITYLLPPTEFPGKHEDQISFVKVAEKINQLYFVFQETPIAEERAKLHLPSPFENLKLFPGPPTSDKNTFAKDGVTRRIILNYEKMDMLPFHLAKILNPNLPAAEDFRGRFNFYDTDQVYINFQPINNFTRYSLMDVVDGKTPADAFKNKLVLVGRDTQEQSTDYINTPYGRDNLAMTRAELYANMVNTLQNNSAPKMSPKWLNAILTFFILLLTIYVVLSLRPFSGILILLATLTVLFTISYLLFWLGGYWLNTSYPLLAMFLCYYFFIPYRLIIENRRSWEYFQKHKLLSEVELLKTNFISMMSHDLKTPLARIQGMTDVIQKDSSPLSMQQREALDTIRSSSQDLLKFISTILNYAKIESQGVELHLESRDVNSLISEVVSKNDFLAKIKHIQIQQELEPLFAISLDPELIKQVLSNLVENAIKYSPENSKILITSEEKNGHVIIQVSDQGMGIPSGELSNIFLKFFRSQGAKSSPIKGSGLGLYLAKYFVELHRGKIYVESSIGQGSTFTVELPIEQLKKG